MAEINLGVLVLLRHLCFGELKCLWSFHDKACYSDIKIKKSLLFQKDIHILGP